MRSPSLEASAPRDSGQEQSISPSGFAPLRSSTADPMGKASSKATHSFGMGQKVVGTAPKDDHLALLAGTGRVPQPGNREQHCINPKSQLWGDPSSSQPGQRQKTRKHHCFNSLTWLRPLPKPEGGRLLFSVPHSCNTEVLGLKTAGHQLPFPQQEAKNSPGCAQEDPGDTSPCLVGGRARTLVLPLTALSPLQEEKSYFS